jgi:D-3-phosphoglycerate dehydrogenase
MWMTMPSEQRRIVVAEDLFSPLPEGYGTGFEVVYDPTLAMDRRRLLELGQRTHGLVVRNQTRVDDELLAAFPVLQVIGRLGVGTDNIDLPACRRRGLKVIVARGGNADSVAEYVLACLLTHARFIETCHHEVVGGKWDRTRAIGLEIHGKTLGIIGIGDIGRRVATRARAFGMRVLAFDPYVMPSSDAVQDLGIQLADLDTVMAESHYISLHVPLTPETHHMLGTRQLKRMRPDAVLINAARGGIVDETALVEALQVAPNRFAFLDVRETEPPAKDDPLLGLPNVRMTPHVAGITRESSERIASFVLEQVVATLSA